MFEDGTLMVLSSASYSRVLGCEVRRSVLLINSNFSFGAGANGRKGKVFSQKIRGTVTILGIGDILRTGFRANLREIEFRWKPEGF